MMVLIQEQVASIWVDLIKRGFAKDMCTKVLFLLASWSSYSFIPITEITTNVPRRRFILGGGIIHLIDLSSN